MNTNNIHVLSRAVIIDQDHLLLCKTLDLDPGFYFLPGGHVEHSESVESALLRELLEETGAQAKIKRFLGCLEYSFEPGHSSICHNHEYNFIFEVESDDLKWNHPIPKLEEHLGLIWAPLNQINNIDFRAEPLRLLLPKWLAAGASDFFHSIMV